MYQIRKNILFDHITNKFGSYTLVPDGNDSNRIYFKNEYGENFALARINLRLFVINNRDFYDVEKFFGLDITDIGVLFSEWLELNHSYSNFKSVPQMPILP